MSSTDAMKRELMSVFQEEAHDLLYKMEENLDILKRNILHRNSDTRIKELFRYAHTLKSSSGTMKLFTRKERFRRLEQVSKILVEIFRAVKDNRIECNDDIILLLLDGIQACWILLKKKEPVGYKELLERLRNQANLEESL